MENGGRKRNKRLKSHWKRKMEIEELPLEDPIRDFDLGNLAVSTSRVVLMPLLSLSFIFMIFSHFLYFKCIYLQIMSFFAVAFHFICSSHVRLISQLLVPRVNRGKEKYGRPYLEPENLSPANQQ